MLDGITVLDLASVGPAARASRWLADYGATVIKVGPVPARQGVQIVPPYYAYSAHRGMKRVLVDLQAPAGRDAFLRLVETADVVIESFRPGVVDRLGIGYADGSAHNPAVIYCSTTGYGQTGPHAQWAGHDLNYLAVSGFLDCSGRGEDGCPPIPGATVADSAGGGLHAVVAILAALVERDRTGQGRHLDVAVADGMLALMALAVDEHLAEGTIPGPGQSLLTGRYACYGIYRTGDGKWLSVAAIEPRFWTNFCTALGLEHHAGAQMDDDAQDAIRADVARVLATRTRDEWVNHLAPADTCVAPVLSVPEVVDDQQFAARGAWATASIPGHPEFRQVGALLAGMDHLTTVSAAAPGATDTVAVLQAAGLTDGELAALQQEGLVA